MAAQLQGVLSALAVAAAGCTAPGAATPATANVPLAAAVPTRVELPQAPTAAAGAAILLPTGRPDAEVARVGDVVLHESDAYRRLLVAHPKIALAAVDLLVFDALVAHHAHEFGVEVPTARIDAAAAAEEQDARAAAGGDDAALAAWVGRTFGTDVAEWRRLLRARAAQRLWAGYTLRYLAGREERVHVRFLVVASAAVAAEVADKARAGADFAVMVRRHSEDPSREQGGELPPFGRDFAHPVATVAFGLTAGEVSAPFQARWGDADRWFVVACIARMPANDAPFAAVATAIDDDLVRRPLTPLETVAYTLRWRQSAVASPARDR